MSMKETARLQRLGALGSMGVAVGVMLLWAVVFFWLVATRVSTSGLDADHSLLIRLTTFFPAFAIALVHLIFARKLSSASRSWHSDGAAART